MEKKEKRQKGTLPLEPKKGKKSTKGLETEKHAFSPNVKPLSNAETEYLSKLASEIAIQQRRNIELWESKKAKCAPLEKQSLAQISRPKAQKTYAQRKRAGFDAVLFMAERGFHFLPWDDKEERPAYKWSGENQNNFTSDINKLLEWQAQGYKRYLYLPGLSGYIGFDIDRGHADGKDGLVGFYEIMRHLAGKSPERLPYSLRDLPNNHPCCIETPSGGLHVLFKYSGPCKEANIIYGDHKLEVMHLKRGLSLGGKPYGIYVLRGDPLDAPELPPFLIELINPKPNPVSQKAAYRSHGKQSLEKILGRVLQESAGHNEAQMKFAWRAAYFGHALEDVLAFVLFHPDDFGTGSDTETVVTHSWCSNKERAVL